MKYYHIIESSHPDILGKNDMQSDETRINGHVDDPLLLNKFCYEKIEVEPKVSNAIIYDDATVTDLIGHCNTAGLGTNLLISSKLKKILEDFKADDVQYFKSNIIHQGKEIDDFWLVHPTDLNMHLIDYSKSEIYMTEVGFKVEEDPIHVRTYDEFEIMSRTLYKEGYKDIKSNVDLTIFRIVIKQDVTRSFINVKLHRGSKHLVSEELKKAIEDAGCTGIEFKPSDMDTFEWYAKNGYRKKCMDIKLIV